MSSDYVPPKYTVEKDSEGYVKSFSLDQPTEIKQFFDKYGFVVINSVFTPKECEDTIDDIWDLIQTMLRTPIDRNDPLTWKNDLWRRTGIYSEGMIGGTSWFTKNAMKNRQNPRLYEAFKTVFGRPDLIVNHDRYGMFRPTVMKLADGTKKQLSEYRTEENLHLDMNAWHYCESKDLTETHTVLDSFRYVAGFEWIGENNQPGILHPDYFQLNVQGLVNLADNKDNDGGFHIVPGFANHFKEWTDNRQNLREKYGIRQTFCVLPSQEPIQRHTMRVTARAGSAILWDQRTAHGSSPNHSCNARYAQFFKMFVSPPLESERMKARAVALRKKMIKAKLDKLSPLGERLFGFKPYPEQEEIAKQ